MKLSTPPHKQFGAKLIESTYMDHIVSSFHGTHLAKIKINCVKRVKIVGAALTVQLVLSLLLPFHKLC